MMIKVSKDISILTAQETMFHSGNSSLCQELIPSQQLPVIRWLRTLEGRFPEVRDFFDSQDDKYSEDIGIKFKHYLFSLYSFYGDTRIGAGGGLTCGSIIRENNVVEDFIETLKKGQDAKYSKLL